MTRCDSCASAENPDKCHIARIGPLRICLCRKCAGKVCRGLLAYIKDFAKKWPARKVPRNPELPIMDVYQQARCRSCERQLDSPMKAYCDACAGIPLERNP